MFSPPHPALNVSDKAFPEYNTASNWVYLFGFNTPGLILWKASNTQSVWERKLIKPIEATSCCHHLWDFSPGYRGHDPSLGKRFIGCAPDNFCSAGLVPQGLPFPVLAHTIPMHIRLAQRLVSVSDLHLILQKLHGHWVPQKKMDSLCLRLWNSSEATVIPAPRSL